MISELNEIWRERHLERNIHFLSDSKPLAVFKIHRLQVPSRQTVLDVGVGLGKMAKFLSEQECTVDCLDIVDEAEKHVVGFARNFFTEKNITKLPSNCYDLALSHCVSQHQDDRSLSEQLHNVCCSLKVNGVFSIQFAMAITEGLRNDLAQPHYQAMAHGSVCRSPEHIVSMIEEVPNAGAELLSDIYEFPTKCSAWRFVRMRRLK